MFRREDMALYPPKRWPDQLGRVSGYAVPGRARSETNPTPCPPGFFKLQDPAGADGAMEIMSLSLCRRQHFETAIQRQSVRCVAHGKPRVSLLPNLP